ncbi:MAG TPA: Rap1a/Tai family immunity protein [Alphaproteobacteria bacterium]|nr:Rap1a/Tai family immunity protein [Alphaproteobacteria bacterium]
MRKVLKRSLLAMPLLVLAAAPARAVEGSDFLLENAQELGALCGANTNVAAIHMCEGFLVGVHRTYQSVASALGERLYCLPADKGITRDDAARDFAAWVSKTPATVTMSPVDGVLEFAHLTYPCR